MSKLQPWLSKVQPSMRTMPMEYGPNAYFYQPSAWILVPPDPRGGGHLIGQGKLEEQLECPRPLEDVEEVNRLLFKPLPGMTSATAPPLIDVTTPGSAAARLLPNLAADHVAGLPPLTEDQLAGMPPLLENQATAHTSKLQPRLPQVNFTAVQLHRFLLLSNPPNEGQAGAPLLHDWS